MHCMYFLKKSKEGIHFEKNTLLEVVHLLDCCLQKMDTTGYMFFEKLFHQCCTCWPLFSMHAFLLPDFIVKPSSSFWKSLLQPPSVLELKQQHWSFHFGQGASLYLMVVGSMLPVEEPALQWKNGQKDPSGPRSPSFSVLGGSMPCPNSLPLGWTKDSLETWSVKGIKISWRCGMPQAPYIEKPFPGCFAVVCFPKQKVDTCLPVLLFCSDIEEGFRQISRGPKLGRLCLANLQLPNDVTCSHL